MSFRTSLLARVEKIRGNIPGRLDLRQYTVTVRVRTWTGARPGVGTKTDVDTVIQNASYNVKVKEVSTRDVVASGGVYQAGDFKVGPLTLEYATGGTAYATIDPATTTTAREVLFKIEGPAFPSGGAWFKRTDDTMVANFTGFIVLRRMAVTP